MNTPSRRTLATILSLIPLLTILPLLGGCGGATISSTWVTGEPPVIDGQLIRTEEHDEWQNSLHLVEDENLHVGLLNDRDALYLCLATRNRSNQMKMLRQGFTLWLDLSGGKGRDLGIHLPPGGVAHFPGNDTPPGEGDFASRGRRPTRGQLPQLSTLMAGQETRPTTVDVMFSRNSSRRMELREVPGVEIAMGGARDILYYELRLPLGDMADNPLALSLEPGGLLGIGFEAQGMEPPERPERMEGGRSGGGVGGDMGGKMGGRGGGRGGGGMGGGGRGGGRVGGEDNSEVFEPLEFWGKILLADPPGADGASG